MRSSNAQLRDTAFFRVFPPPKFLRMPAVGIDISDHSVRFVEFKEKSGKKIVFNFGQESIPEGVLAYGDIKNSAALADILRNLGKREKISFVRGSLPEEKAYLFKIDVPVLTAEETRDNIAFQLEDNVPIKAADAVFDYVFLPQGDGPTNSRETVVTVFPRKVVEEYLSLYQKAGFTVLSFEMEANAIARALITKGDLGSYMIVDFGQQRTGLSIIERGVVQFTSTVEVGGNLLTTAVQKQFNVSFEEAEQIKREETFVGHGAHQEFFTSLMNSVAALSDEINKHYVYWHTHADKKGRKPQPIQKIILSGGDANLAGLAEHLSLSLKTKVELANVWINVLSLDEEIPPISFGESLSYATAVGLGLRGL